MALVDGLQILCNLFRVLERPDLHDENLLQGFLFRLGIEDAVVDGERGIDADTAPNTASSIRGTSPGIPFR